MGQNSINLPTENITYVNFGTTTVGGFINAKDVYYTTAGEGIATFYIPLSSGIQPGQSFQVISGDPAGWQLVPDTGQIIRWIDSAGVTHESGLGTSVSSNGIGSQVTATSATIMYVGGDVFIITNYTGNLKVV